jgi:cytochrome c peroxidase
MKKKFLLRTLAAALFSAMLAGGAAWGGNPLPLSAVPVPEPPNLAEFVKDKTAAIKLGKALFWDMQVGSDGVTACATCHYRAGADPLQVRATNQLNPGPDANFDVKIGPNQLLATADFPFLQVNPVDAKLGSGNGAITNNKNDVAGSQGVSLTDFTAIVLGNPVDGGTAASSPLFGSSRQVTGANTPPAVNAIFNYANFWDGRANNTFNGNNPIGPLDVNAGVWVIVGAAEDGVIAKQKIAIANASLASQATGPPLSAVEMSWNGRTWPQLGRKMLSLPPLALQKVDPTDSVLGGSANAGTGINTTYIQMIKDAFQPNYWSSTAKTPDGFTQMEANFSLFWGLAIQLYEATLVSDQTPFDKYLAGDNAAMTAQEIKGFGTFQSKCGMCHSGTELSDATYSEAFANGLIDKGQTNAGGAISDNGFHNIGVRPTADNKGRGGVINFDLSFARQALDQANGTIPFAAPQALPDGVTAATPAAVDGSFKTPQLRNVALTAPYMHNGSMATLAEVVEFYSRGGNFANAELAKEMNAPTGIGAQDRADIVAFLNALTDPRVANDTAPFDHPELRIPGSGEPGAAMITLNAKGAGGTSATAHASMTTTLADLPKATIAGAPAALTNETSATLSVAITNGDSFTYSLDGGAPVTTAANPITLTNLADGPHTVTVLGVNSAAKTKQVAANAAKATWTVNTAPPALAVGTVETMTKKDVQTVTGTVETGGKVAVTVDTGATVGPVTVSGTTWSCQVSGLKKGTNNITVTATSAAGNKSSKTATVKILIADGCYRGTGSPDISDALKSLKIAVGIITATEDDLLHGDVTTDGKIDTGDALLTLRKVAGLASF